MEKCNICPRRCNADRAGGQKGFCGVDNKILVARVAPHYWEEPCISGEKGSGAIFFGGCNLRCCYCQNSKISRGAGKEYSAEQLADAIKQLEKQGVHNINFVTPTHYTTQILEALDLYMPSVPIVWNTSAYERVETLRLLEGKISIYLPDFKYINPQTAKAYSAAEDYPSIAASAIEEMVRQVGNAALDREGIMQKGVIIRHLCLPTKQNESIEALRFLHKKFGDSVYYSVMSQFTPQKNTPYSELSRRVNQNEYDALLCEIDRLDIQYGYTQEFSSASEEYIPEFEV